MVRLEHTVAYCQSMATLTTRDWILAAVQRLSAEGIDAVKIEPLAAELGVSKGSFYWHFGGRAELLTAMLETWEALGTEAIISDVDRNNNDPAERIRLLMERTFGDPEFDGIELGIRAWARHDPAAAAVVARVDARRVAYVSSLVEAAGYGRDEAMARADITYRTLIGEFVLRSGGAQALPPDALRALGEWLTRP